jgi:hypothetical protein
MSESDWKELGQGVSDILTDVYVFDSQRIRVAAARIGVPVEFVAALKVITYIREQAGGIHGEEHVRRPGRLR